MHCFTTLWYERVLSYTSLCLHCNAFSPWSGETLNTLCLGDLKSSEGASPSVFVVPERLLASSHALSCISSDARCRAFEFISISSDMRGRALKIICIVMLITRRALSRFCISMHQHASFALQKQAKKKHYHALSCIFKRKTKKESDMHCHAFSLSCTFHAFQKTKPKQIVHMSCISS